MLQKLQHWSWSFGQLSSWSLKRKELDLIRIGFTSSIISQFLIWHAGQGSILSSILTRKAFFVRASLALPIPSNCKKAVRHTCTPPWFPVQVIYITHQKLKSVQVIYITTQNTVLLWTIFASRIDCLKMKMTAMQTHWILRIHRHQHHLLPSLNNLPGGSTTSGGSGC